jgi:pyruvate dehydrogenase E1 component alpha subunit
MAVGVAMADRLRGKDTITVTFFGDGGANEGAVHEAMNLAGSKRIPIVFIAENNGIAISMRVSESTAAPDLACRAAGYGMPGQVVDGQDPIAVHEATTRAVARARAGHGPSLIELRIARWESHVEGFPELRSAEEVASARSHDGVARLRKLLLDGDVLSEADVAMIEAGCRNEVDDAVIEGLRDGLDLAEPAPYSAADAQRLTFAP